MLPPIIDVGSSVAASDEIAGSRFPSIRIDVSTRATFVAIEGDELPPIPTTLPRQVTDLKIDGNGLPSIFMPVQSRIEKVSTARDVIAGVKKRFTPGAAQVVCGKTFTTEQIIARYEAQLAALEQVRLAYIAWQGALLAERKLRKPMIALTLDLKRFVNGNFGPSAFGDFGWKPPKKPGPKTVKAKLAGVEKRRKNKR
jgi:hypothetical protein